MKPCSSTGFHADPPRACRRRLSRVRSRTYPILPPGSETLVRQRNLKPAGSAYALVRGSTVKFYEWLEESKVKHPAGPSIWICGHCHVGNLRPLADSDANVNIQIRISIGPSLETRHTIWSASACHSRRPRGSDLPGVTTAYMLEEIIAGYRQ